ncbi:hypothetical protein [Nocardia altamirensis]|uniref:hypothetical protein n=1 Tax=Nocardia altamirensis TaxID=472158 RepID=UPI00114CC2A5|nr:hypothetical protein [Nocardia altamirensis]
MADVKAIAQRWNLRGDYAPSQHREWPNPSLAEERSEHLFHEDARRFALEVLRAVDGGVAASEVWAQILEGGRSLRRSAHARGVVE